MDLSLFEFSILVFTQVVTTYSHGVWFGTTDSIKALNGGWHCKSDRV